MNLQINSPRDAYDFSKRAVRQLRERGIDSNPEIMLILGSGCGDVADEVRPAKIISYENIMGMPPSTVESHAGKMIIGKYEGKDVVALSGRNHYYEGNSAQEASYMVYIAHHLGAKVAIMTAAAGIAPDLRTSEDADFLKDSTYPAEVGDVMLIKTYFPNFLPSSLRGLMPEGVGKRFNPAFDIPSKSLRVITQGVARRLLNDRLKDALYVPRQGPNYETPAEVTFLSHMGKMMELPALGGMSTVPELEAANMLGMRTLALAVVTNKMHGMPDKVKVEGALYAQVGDQILKGGVSKYTLDELDAMVRGDVKKNEPRHEEVTEVAESKHVTDKLEKIIGGVVRAIRF